MPNKTKSWLIDKLANQIYSNMCVYFQSAIIDYWEEIDFYPETEFINPKLGIDETVMAKLIKNTAEDDDNPYYELTDEEIALPIIKEAIEKVLDEFLQKESYAKP